MLKKWKSCRKAVLFYFIKSGFYDLIIEGESMEVMSKLSIPDINYSQLGHIFQEIKMLVVGIRNGFFSRVSQSGNSVSE